MNRKTATFCAVLAAALYALNAPVSKLLLSRLPSTMMAALLYLARGWAWRGSGPHSAQQVLQSASSR